MELSFEKDLLLFELLLQASDELCRLQAPLLHLLSEPTAICLLLQSRGAILLGTI